MKKEKELPIVGKRLTKHSSEKCPVEKLQKREVHRATFDTHLRGLLNVPPPHKKK